MKKIGFIGTGYMGGALATAASKSGLDIEILLANRHKEKAEALCKQIGGTVTDNKTVVKEADYIFLGVKPQILETVYQDIKDVLEHRTDRYVIVSMIAGKELPFLKEMFGSKPIIRIMPNTPALVGAGMTGYTLEEKLYTQEEIGEARGILKSFSEIVQVEERLMDTVTTVSGSGPAYVYMFINALADAGVRYGLTKKDAIRMAAQTVYGSAKMVLETGEHPEVLRDNVCSPGGTTIAAVAAMDEAGFRNAILKGCEACYYKSTGKA